MLIALEALWNVWCCNVGSASAEVAFHVAVPMLKPLLERNGRAHSSPSAVVVGRLGQGWMQWHGVQARRQRWAAVGGLRKCHRAVEAERRSRRADMVGRQSQGVPWIYRPAAVTPAALIGRNFQCALCRRKEKKPCVKSGQQGRVASPAGRPPSYLRQEKGRHLGDYGRGLNPAHTSRQTLVHARVSAIDGTSRQSG